MISRDQWCLLSCVAAACIGFILIAYWCAGSPNFLALQR